METVLASKGRCHNSRGFPFIMYVYRARPLRAFLRIAAALGVAASFVAPTAAGCPPKTFKASKDEIARRCDSLGDRASYTDWDYKPGEYGCVDTKTGFILICKEADESCKLYFPRRKPSPIGRGFI
jgi:hypothetical protein